MSLTVSRTNPTLIPGLSKQSVHFHAFLRFSTLFRVFILLARLIFSVESSESSIGDFKFEKCLEKIEAVCVVPYCSYKGLVHHSVVELEGRSS
jgi:hypothetical protein